jgi:hypothetical protein
MKEKIKYEIKESKEMGKGIYIKEEELIETGETIITEKPITSVIIDSLIESNCSHCYKVLKKKMRCSYCKYIF